MIRSLLYNTSLWLLAMGVMMGMICSACDGMETSRVPDVGTRIVFNTEGDWHLYGVSAHGDYKYFIIKEGTPRGYSFKAQECTGYAGVLLTCSSMNEPLAYDLACPECIPSARKVVLDEESPMAGHFRCNYCGSVYDVYAFGAAVSGPAHQHKYPLKRFNVNIMGSMPYAIIQ